MKFEETKLIEVAKPYFSLARSGDWEHALRVVRWVKELGEGRDDFNLLVTAAYIHDIGWSGIAPMGKIDLDEMIRLEPLANLNSLKLVPEVLVILGFNEEQIEIIQRLVSAADKHASSKEDEAIIVDADSLSKLCLDHLTQKYQPESFAKVLDLWERELPGRIKTDQAKVLFPRLLLELRESLKN